MNARGRIAIAVVMAACVAAGAWGIARAVRANSSALLDYDVRWEFAALCLAAMLCFAVVYAFCWLMLLSALEGRPLRRGPVVRLFLLTWPGRYVPASLPYYGARLAAGPSIGARRSTIAASFVYENLFAIASSGGVALVLLLALSRGRIGGGLWVAAAVGAAVVAATMLHRAVPRFAIRIASKRVRRLAPLEDHLLPTAALVRVFAAYVAGAMLVGTSFWLAALALGADVSPLTAIAVYNLAGVAGMLAIAVPGGVGVREGVVVALLSGVVSPPVALAAALVARLAGIVADLIPFAAIVAFEACRRVGAARSGTVVEPQPVLREAA